MTDAPVKRILRAFKLLEVSGVDRPAQKGARVAILKSEQTTMYTKAEAIREIDKLMQEPPTFTRAEVGDEIDELVRSCAKADGLTFEKAYTQLLKTDIGSKLYALYKKAPHDIVPLVDGSKAPSFSGQAPLTPQGKKEMIASSIEALAREKAKASGVPFTQAYKTLLDSDDGRKLYNAYRGAA